MRRTPNRQTIGIPKTMVSFCAIKACHENVELDAGAPQCKKDVFLQNETEKLLKTLGVVEEKAENETETKRRAERKWRHNHM